MVPSTFRLLPFFPLVGSPLSTFDLRDDILNQSRQARARPVFADDSGHLVRFFVIQQEKNKATLRQTSLNRWRVLLHYPIASRIAPKCK